MTRKSTVGSTDTVAVSYTHLDVYKRQIQNRHPINIDLRGQCGMNRLVGIHIAVSYTHLDVYKRQPLFLHSMNYRILYNRL